MPRPTDMYPDGYPTGTYKPCWNYHIITGALCIIDNAHPGRPHWGRNREGQYSQWELSSGAASSVLRSSPAPNY